MAVEINTKYGLIVQITPGRNSPKQLFCIHSYLVSSSTSPRYMLTMIKKPSFVVKNNNCKIEL